MNESSSLSSFNLWHIYKYISMFLKKNSRRACATRKNHSERTSDKSLGFVKFIHMNGMRRKKISKRQQQQWQLTYSSNPWPFGHLKINTKTRWNKRTTKKSEYTIGMCQGRCASVRMAVCTSHKVHSSLIIQPHMKKLQNSKSQGIFWMSKPWLNFKLLFFLPKNFWPWRVSKTIAIVILRVHPSLCNTTLRHSISRLMAVILYAFYGTHSHIFCADLSVCFKRFYCIVRRSLLCLYVSIQYTCISECVEIA